MDKTDELLDSTEIKKIIFHPQYNEITHMADLALIKTNPALKFSSFPLFLPSMSPTHLYENVRKYQKAYVVWKLKFNDEMKSQYNFEEITDFDIFYQNKADKCPPPTNNPK